MVLVYYTYLFSISFFTSMQDGISPVYGASQNGHTEVVDLLVQAGADIHLATTGKVHVSTHTMSSSVEAVVETNVRLPSARTRSEGYSSCLCLSVYLSISR